MKSATQKLIILLIGVVALAAYMKTSNPNKKYSTDGFWSTATIMDVNEIPGEALFPGNENGSILMWAATDTTNPEIISALIARGSNVNEPDIIFSGTPLSGAAAYNSNPKIIDVLISNGAEINKVVGSNDKTPLIIAAELNPNQEIIERLIHHGADIHYKDKTGKTALEQAIRFKNETAIQTLKEHTK
jgi:ankyrin repeat protein